MNNDNVSQNLQGLNINNGRQMEDNLNNLAKQTRVVAGDDNTLKQTTIKSKTNLSKTNISTSFSSGSSLKSVKGLKNLLTALLVKKLISPEKVKEIKLLVATKNINLEEYLIKNGLISEDDIIKTKAEMYGIDYVNIRSISIDKEVLNLVPQAEARKNLAVAYSFTRSGKVNVAMVEPLDLQKVRYLETLMGKRVVAHFASKTAILEVIDREYGAPIGSQVSEALEDIGEDVVELSTLTKVEDISKDMESAPVSQIVNMILEYALRYKASDVHIEPREKKIAVRFRIYGVLSEKLTLPKKLANPIVSRIKILSNLKIDEKRIPQDGRFQVKNSNKLIDIRVSIMPTVYGEKIVLRLLEKGGGTMDLKDTGLRGPAYKIYLENLKKTQGIILITGPTGSGKTQTLASSLKILNKPEVNIMTIEDPVEIRIDGITQVQVNNEVGLTFAKALRSFLRQDPDIIMVGEIRDSETAELAIQAALTGHLVLATLHTNSAAGALPRLLDMGIEPFLLSSTINIVVAQRLVRKIHDKCKQSYKAPLEVIKRIHKELDGLRGFDLFSYVNNDPGSTNVIDDDIVNLYKGTGDPECNYTGFQGRTAIFEAMLVTPVISKMIMQEKSAEEIERVAIEEGMITMLQDGFMKALEGITTIEEVLRVVNY